MSYTIEITINHNAICPMTSFPLSLRFEKAPVTFSGALRDDATGAHSFLFMRSRGIPHSHCPCDMQWQFETHTSQLNSSDNSVPDIPPNMHKVSSGPGRGRWPESPHDVYCCIKRFAADQQLSQDMVRSISRSNMTWQVIWKAYSNLLYPKSKNSLQMFTWPLVATWYFAAHG